MSIKQKTFVSAVVYVCDSEIVLSSFLKRLYSVLDDNFEKFEIICVNDASTDNGREVIKNLARELKSNMLSVINMSYWQGLERAMCAGVDLAIGDFVFEFDGTVMDYECNLIMQIYNRSLEGYDIVSCGKGYLNTLSKLFYSIYNKYSGTQYKLKSETFRILSRRAINRVHSLSTSLPYRKALYSNCGLKTDYVYYKPIGTVAIPKRMLKSSYDTAITALILFTNIAYKSTVALTFIMMLLTLTAAVYVITRYLKGVTVPGYTTTMLLSSGAFFAVFAVLTIIIKYLSIILGIIFNRQKYAIESIEKINL